MDRKKRGGQPKEKKKGERNKRGGRPIEKKGERDGALAQSPISKEGEKTRIGTVLLLPNDPKSNSNRVEEDP